MDFSYLYKQWVKKTLKKKCNKKTNSQLQSKMAAIRNKQIYRDFAIFGHEHYQTYII